MEVPEDGRAEMGRLSNCKIQVDGVGSQPPIPELRLNLAPIIKVSSAPDDEPDEEDTATDNHTPKIVLQPPSLASTHRTEGATSPHGLSGGLLLPRRKSMIHTSPQQTRRSFTYSPAGSRRASVVDVAQFQGETEGKTTDEKEGQVKRGRSLSVGSILGDMSIARPSEKGSLFLQTQNRLEIPSQIPSQRSHQDLQAVHDKLASLEQNEEGQHVSIERSFPFDFPLFDLNDDDLQRIDERAKNVVDRWAEYATSNRSVRSEDGFTLVMEAAVVDSVKSIELLYEYSVDLFAEDEPDETMYKGLSPRPSQETETRRTDSSMENVLDMPPSPIREWFCSMGLERRGRSTALHYAALAGAERVLRFLLLADGVSDTMGVYHALCRANGSGLRPLHFAALSGNISAVKCLRECLEHSDGSSDEHWRALCVCTDDFKRTPLHYACLLGFADLIPLLCSALSLDDICVADADGLFPQFHAALEGHIDCLKTFAMLYGNDIYKAVDAHGTGAAILAASKGQLAVLEFLHSGGVDLGQPDEDGFTASHAAATDGNVEVLRFLFERKIPLDKVDIDGLCPVHYAAGEGCTEALRFLANEARVPMDQSTGDGQSPLHYAASKGFDDSVHELLNSGASVTKACSDGMNSICYAATGGSISVMQQLLDSGVDLKQSRSLDGKGPVYLALMKDHVEAALWLLEHNFPADTQGRDGSAPAHRAAQKGYSEVIRQIAERGFSQTFLLKTRAGFLPCHYAAQKGHREVLEILDSYNAVVRTPLDDGMTLAHIACSGEDVDVLAFLRDTGHSLDETLRRKEDNRRPIQVAAEKGHGNTVIFLIENGIDWKTPSCKGTNVAHLCAAKGALDALKLIAEKVCGELNDLLWFEDHESRALPHIAASHGRIEVLRWMLSIVISPDCILLRRTSKGGFYPAHFAAGRGHTDVLDLYFEYKLPCLRLENSAGLKVPFLAAAEGQSSVFTYFQDKKVALDSLDIDEKDQKNPWLDDLKAWEKWEDKKGRNLCHIAAYKGKLRALKRLLHVRSHDLLSSPGLIRFPTTRKSIAAIDKTPMKVVQIEGRPDPPASSPLWVRDANGMLPLHLAVIAGHLSVVKFFWQYGMPVQGFHVRTHPDGLLPIHLAASHGKVDLLKFFRDECKCDLRESTDAGLTLCHVAAMRGHVAVLRFVSKRELECGKNGQERMSQRPSRVQRALKFTDGEERSEKTSGDETVGLSLEDQTGSGLSPLMCAAQFDQLEVVDYLIGEGVDLGAVDEYRRNVVFYAAIGGSVDVLSRLKDLKIDVLPVDKQGNTPMQLAAREGHVNVLDFYFFTVLAASEQTKSKRKKSIFQPFRKKEKASASYRKMAEDDVNTVTELGSDDEDDAMESDDDEQATVASKSMSTISMKRLSKSSFSLSSFKNNYGHSLLHSAAEGGQFHVVRYLLDHGFNVHELDRQGMTAGHLAAYLGQPRVLRALQEAGADLEYPGKDGVLPVHCAVQRGSLLALKYLQACGYSLEVGDSAGNTCAHYAMTTTSSETGERTLGRSEQEKDYSSEFERLFHAFQVGDEDMHRDAIVAASRRGEARDSVTSVDNDDQTVVEDSTHRPATQPGKSMTVKILRYLHENGFSLELRNARGAPAAFTAAEYGRYDALLFLSAINVNLDVRDDYGQTLAHAAAEKGQVEVLRCLRALDLPLGEPDAFGRAPASLAAMNGHLVALRYLRETGNLSLNTIKSKKKTRALEDMSVTKVEQSLRSIAKDRLLGADRGEVVPLEGASRIPPSLLHVLETEDEEVRQKKEAERNFPLLLAILGGHLDVVRFLLNQGMELVLEVPRTLAASLTGEQLKALMTENLSERGSMGGKANVSRGMIELCSRLSSARIRRVPPTCALISLPLFVGTKSKTMDNDVLRSLLSRAKEAVAVNRYDEGLLDESIRRRWSSFEVERVLRGDFMEACLQPFLSKSVSDEILKHPELLVSTAFNLLNLCDARSENEVAWFTHMVRQIFSASNHVIVLHHILEASQIDSVVVQSLKNPILRRLSPFVASSITPGSCMPAVDARDRLLLTSTHYELSPLFRPKAVVMLTIRGSSIPKVVDSYVEGLRMALLSELGGAVDLLNIVAIPEPETISRSSQPSPVGKPKNGKARLLEGLDSVLCGVFMTNMLKDVLVPQISVEVAGVLPSWYADVVKGEAMCILAPPETVPPVQMGRFNVDGEAHGDSEAEQQRRGGDEDDSLLPPVMAWSEFVRRVEASFGHPDSEIDPEDLALVSLRGLSTMGSVVGIYEDSTYLLLKEKMQMATKKKRATEKPTGTAEVKDLGLRKRRLSVFVSKDRGTRGSVSKPIAVILHPSWVFSAEVLRTFHMEEDAAPKNHLAQPAANMQFSVRLLRSNSFRGSVGAAILSFFARSRIAVLLEDDPGFGDGVGSISPQESSPTAISRTGSPSSVSALGTALSNVLFPSMHKHSLSSLPPLDRVAASPLLGKRRWLSMQVPAIDTSKLKGEWSMRCLMPFAIHSKRQPQHWENNPDIINYSHHVALRLECPGSAGVPQSFFECLQAMLVQMIRGIAAASEANEAVRRVEGMDGGKSPHSNTNDTAWTLGRSTSAHHVAQGLNDKVSRGNEGVTGQKYHSNSTIIEDLEDTLHECDVGVNLWKDSVICLARYKRSDVEEVDPQVRHSRGEDTLEIPAGEGAVLLIEKRDGGIDIWARGTMPPPVTTSDVPSLVKLPPLFTIQDDGDVDVNAWREKMRAEKEAAAQKRASNLLRSLLFFGRMGALLTIAEHFPGLNLTEHIVSPKDLSNDQRARSLWHLYPIVNVQSARSKILHEVTTAVLSDHRDKGKKSGSFSISKYVYDKYKSSKGVLKSGEKGDDALENLLIGLEDELFSSEESAILKKLHRKKRKPKLKKQASDGDMKKKAQLMQFQAMTAPGKDRHLLAPPHFIASPEVEEKTVTSQPHSAIQRPQSQSFVYAEAGNNALDLANSRSGLHLASVPSSVLSYYSSLTDRHFRVVISSEAVPGTASYAFAEELEVRIRMREPRARVWRDTVEPAGTWEETRQRELLIANTDCMICILTPEYVKRRSCLHDLAVAKRFLFEDVHSYLSPVSATEEKLQLQHEIENLGASNFHKHSRKKKHSKRRKSKTGDLTFGEAALQLLESTQERPADEERRSSQKRSAPTRRPSIFNEGNLEICMKGRVIFLLFQCTEADVRDPPLVSAGPLLEDLLSDTTPLFVGPSEEAREKTMQSVSNLMNSMAILTLGNAENSH